MHETHSIMKVFNGKLSEALVNQVQFTFRCNCFEPEERKKHIFNNPVNTKADTDNQTIRQSKLTKSTVHNVFTLTEEKQIKC